MRMLWRLLFLIFSAPAIAASAIDGQTRYLNLCSGCHSATPDHRAKYAADNPDFLRLAVNTVSGMGFLQRLLTSPDYDNIAAYIGDTSLNENVLSVAPLGNGLGSITSTPRGIACGGNCAWGYPIGATVQLQAKPDWGSAFSGWSGACVGNGSCELDVNGAKTVFATFARNGASQDYSGLWWGGTVENGWGVSITHRAGSGQQFVALYIYDAAGEPTWAVMPGGVWSDDFSRFTGKLYQPQSAPLDRYDRDMFRIGDNIGELSLQFLSNSQIELRYQANGASGTKSLQRQSLSAQQTLPRMNVRDLWWAGEVENGWGLTIAQQAEALFAVWYSYDRAGRPIWFVLPTGAWDGTRYQGSIYQTRSSAWAGVTYDASRFVATDIGTLSLDVRSLSHIEMRAHFNRGDFSGVKQTKLLERQPF